MGAGLTKSQVANAYRRVDRYILKELKDFPLVKSAPHYWKVKDFPIFIQVRKIVASNAETCFLVCINGEHSWGSLAIRLQQSIVKYGKVGVL